MLLDSRALSQKDLQKAPNLSKRLKAMAHKCPVVLHSIRMRVKVKVAKTKVAKIRSMVKTITRMRRTNQTFLKTTKSKSVSLNWMLVILLLLLQ